ncbi:MAG: hypothetical protein ACTHLT_07110 [Devosia sp.]
MEQVRTRISDLAPGWRRAVLALAAAAMALLLAVVVFRAPVAAPAEGAVVAGDAASYGRIVERLRGGEGYYAAAHEVLLADGYGTRSVFNWRTPAWPTLVAALPPGGGQAVLGALAAAGLVLTFRMFRTAGVGVAGVSVLAAGLSLGAVLAPEAVLFAEVAAGALILVSVAAYGNGWRWLGWGAAVLALCVRELAAPYVLVCVLLSLRGRHWREAAAWGGAGLAYAAYFGWHWWMVLAQLGPLDRAYAEGWVAFGGLDFVLGTAGFNGLWGLGPDWLPAVLLPLGLLGLWAWPRGRALAGVGLYVASFLVIGKPFNAYWGAVYTPVLMLGLGWVAPAVVAAMRPVRAAAPSPQLR